MYTPSRAKRTTLSLAITFAIAGAYSTCITPDIMATAQAKEQSSSSSSQNHMRGMLEKDKDGKPNPTGKNTKAVKSTVTGEKISEKTQNYNRLVKKLEAQDSVEDTSGIDVALKKLRDGTGHNTKSQTFINSSNGFTPGDNTENDGYVTAGDTVTYEFSLNFAPGKKRHIDIIWSDVVDENGESQSANNLCDSSEAGITAVGNSQGYCRYIIEEGATGSITRQISYKAPNSTDGSTKFKWAPKIYTSKGEMKVPEVTVLSAPAFDMKVSSDKATYGSSNSIKVNSESYTPSGDFSYRKGNYKGEVKPFKVEVDVSQFPEGTVFPKNDVSNGKIILEFNNTSQSQNIDYILPKAKEEDQSYKKDWNVSINVLDSMETKDGSLNMGNGKDPYLTNNSTTIKAFVEAEREKGDILSKRIATPNIISGNTIYDEASKKWNDDKFEYGKVVAPGTQIESHLTIHAKENNHSAPKMHLIDAWDPKDAHFDPNREVSVKAEGTNSDVELDYDIYYATKDIFAGNNDTPSMPSWDDSSWTKQKPSDTKSITGVKLVVNNNDEIDEGTIQLRVPQVTLREQDYELDKNVDGAKAPIPDWYQAFYTAKDTTLSNSAVYSKDINVVGSVYPKPVIDRSTNVDNNTKTLGDKITHTINPYIYDVMSAKENQLHPEIVEYLDKCLAEVEFSEETKEYYNIDIEGTPGDNCRIEDGKPTKVTLTPKSSSFDVKSMDYRLGKKIKDDGLTPSILDNSVRLPAIKYSAQFSYDTPAYQKSGYSYDNSATITLPEAQERNRVDNADTHTTILQKTDVSAVKTSEKTRVGLDDELSWNLEMNNFSGKTGRAEFIDVLPWNGSQAKTSSGETTKFNGTLDFVSADFVDAPQGAKILYTNAEPGSIDASQKDQPGVTWYDSSDKAGGAEKVTAIKIVIPDFGGKNSSHLNVKINAMAEGAHNGDVYVNKMSSVDLDNGLDVPAPGAVSVKSVSSNLSGSIWWDKNHSYTNDGEDGISGVKVYARRAGSNDILETTTDDKGFYQFKDIHSGKYDIWFDRGDEKGKVPENGTTTYNKTEKVQQTFSYGGDVDDQAQEKVSAFVMSAQDLENVDFGFMTPDPLLKVDKRITSQEDNSDGTVTVDYNVSATNTGTGTMKNVQIMDSADKKQNISAEISTSEGGGDYVQVEHYVPNFVSMADSFTLAIDKDGNLYVSTNRSDIDDGISSMKKVDLPEGVKATKLGKDMPTVQLSNGHIGILSIEGYAQSFSNEDSPLVYVSGTGSAAEGTYAMMNYVHSKDGSPLSINNFHKLAPGGSFYYQGKDGKVTQYIALNDYQNLMPSYDNVKTFPEGTTVDVPDANYGFGTSHGEDVSIPGYITIPLTKDKDGKIIPDGIYKDIVQDENIKGNIVYMAVTNSHQNIVTLSDNGKVYNSVMEGDELNSEGYKTKELYIPSDDYIQGISSNYFIKTGRNAKGKFLYALRGEKGLYMAMRIDGKVQVFPISDSSGDVVTSHWGNENIFTWVEKDGSVKMVDLDDQNISQQIKDGISPKVKSKEVLSKGSVDPYGVSFINEDLGYAYGIDKDKLSGAYLNKDGELSVFPMKENSSLEKVAEGNFSYVDETQNLFKNTDNNRLFMASRILNEKIINGYDSGYAYNDIYSYYTLYQEDTESEEDKNKLESTIDDYSRAVAEKYFVSSEEIESVIPIVKSIIRSLIAGNEDEAEKEYSNLSNAISARKAIYIDKDDSVENRGDNNVMQRLYNAAKNPNNKLDDSSWMIKALFGNTVLGDTSQYTNTRSVEPASLKNDGDRTIRTYDAGDIKPGQSANLRLRATISKDKKEQFLSNLTWVRGDKTPDDVKEPKDPKVPSSIEEFRDNDWGVDTGNDLKANVNYADDNDFYDGVPVYIAGDDQADEEVTIGGHTFKDDNKNGEKDPDEKENVSGVKVKITTTGDNPKTIGETVTGEDGSWSYKVPKGQDYTIIFDAGNIGDKENNYTPTGKTGSTLKTSVITEDDNTYDMGYATSPKGFDTSKVRSGSTPKIVPGKSFEDKFTISVTNNLGKDDTLGEIVDNPVVPKGVTVDNIQWKKQGDKDFTTAVKRDEGGYLIGNKEDKISRNETVVFDVVMNVTVDKDFSLKDINSDEGTDASGDKDYGNIVNTPGHKDVDPKNNGGEFNIDNPDPDNGDDNTPDNGDNSTPDNPDDKPTPGNNGRGDAGIDKGGNDSSGNNHKGSSGDNSNTQSTPSKKTGEDKPSNKGGKHHKSSSNTPGKTSNSGKKSNDSTHTGKGGASQKNPSSQGASVVGPEVNTGGEISQSFWDKILNIFR